MSGYIYVLANDSFPEQLKIGRTNREAEIRSKELSNTSVPMPFYIVFQLLVSDSIDVEKRVHKRLEEFRTSSNREFFKISRFDAVNIILDESGIRQEDSLSSHVASLVGRTIILNAYCVKIVVSRVKSKVELLTQSVVVGEFSSGEDDKIQSVINGDENFYKIGYTKKPFYEFAEECGKLSVDDDSILYAVTIIKFEEGLRCLDINKLLSRIGVTFLSGLSLFNCSPEKLEECWQLVLQFGERGDHNDHNMYIDNYPGEKWERFKV